MRFAQRLVANAIATYLVLYLVDSVAKGRFLVAAVWVAVLLALVLGFMNSLIKPLRRVRTRPARALIISLLTLLMNVVFVQVFHWATPLHSTSLAWTILVAAFVAVVTGTIDWLIGFGVPAKVRSRSAASSEKGPVKRPSTSGRSSAKGARPRPAAGRRARDRS